MPEHNGVPFEVQRRESDSPTGYEYEFVLVVDGNEVTTATELERAGWSGPEAGGFNWTRNLTNYAHGYIEGAY